MNLVEHYIVEVHKVRESRIREGFLIIDLTVDYYYGNNIRLERYCSKEQWEDDKIRGYYLE